MMRETMLISLIKMLSAGPEVSLNGSPTVSPTTAALWVSLPLPPRFPASIYFLALSQAPPELAMNIAIKKPVTMAPAKTPPKAAGPKVKPMMTGTMTARIPGIIISLRAELVTISTVLA